MQTETQSDREIGMESHRSGGTGGWKLDIKVCFPAPPPMFSMPKCTNRDKLTHLVTNPFNDSFAYTIRPTAPGRILYQSRLEICQNVEFWNSKKSWTNSLHISQINQKLGNWYQQHVINLLSNHLILWWIRSENMAEVLLRDREVYRAPVELQSIWWLWSYGHDRYSVKTLVKNK